MGTGHKGQGTRDRAQSTGDKEQSTGGRGTEVWQGSDSALIHSPQKHHGNHCCCESSSLMLKGAILLHGKGKFKRCWRCLITCRGGSAQAHTGDVTGWAEELQGHSQPVGMDSRKQS